MPNYLPYEQRIPDTQYKDILRKILDEGQVAENTRQGVSAPTIFQQTMRFNLSNGAPVCTERDLGAKTGWRAGIGELFAMINGVTTAAGMEEFGVKWWGQWTDAEKCAMFGLEPGDIGPASYGGAFRNFPTLDGDRFDQWANLIRQINELPDDRVHRITPWMPKENARGIGTQKTTIAPCHGDVFVRILNGRIHLLMVQRSADTLIGVPHNMIQYGVGAMLAIEHLTPFTAGVYYHTLWDAHFYAGPKELEAAREVVRRESRPYPTVHLSEEGRQVKDIHDFRGHHFVIDDYYPNPAIPGIPART